MLIKSRLSVVAVVVVVVVVAAVGFPAADRGPTAGNYPRIRDAVRIRIDRRSVAGNDNNDPKKKVTRSQREKKIIASHGRPTN